VLDESKNVMKSYIYENSRIITQRTGGQSATEYFYVKDRLGSVRQIIDSAADIEWYYTYGPFGKLLESGTQQYAPNNNFMFTGRCFDDEIRKNINNILY